MSLWKKISAFVLVLTVTFSCIIFHSTAEKAQNTDMANKLKALNLFIGSDKGFELDKNFTREQSVIMVLRLQALENTAKAQNIKPTFTDVPAKHWAASYIAYATNTGLTKGIGYNKFGLGSNVTTSQYVTYVLRALGYDDSKGDFDWAQAVDKALQIGLLSSTEAKYFNNKASIAMLRDDVVAISYSALKAKLKGSDKTLVRKLLDAGALTVSQVNAVNDASLTEALKATPTATSTRTPTPTPTPTATSNAKSPYIQIEAESFNVKSGVEVSNCIEGGQDIEWIENGDYIVFNNLDFGSGASGFEARVATETGGGNIEIRLDSINGRHVGSCSVTNTGGWQSWVTRTCSISGATGKHDVYIRFTGNAGFLFSVNWIKFIAVAPTPVAVLFSDDFGDNNANGWVPYGGTWVVDQGKYVMNSGSEGKSLVHGTNYTNFIYTADVTIGTSGNAGLIFDVTNPGIGTNAFNGYYVGIDANANTIELMRMSSNTCTILNNLKITVQPYVAYKLKVIRSGNSISIYFNDMKTPRMEAYDNAYLSGSVGVRAVNTRAVFDNISVGNIIATPTPTPLPTPAYRSPDNPGYTVNGLDYRYYEAYWDILPGLYSSALNSPNRTDDVRNFILDPKNREDHFGFYYTGYIDIGTGGNYTFYTNSDDGSRLYIGDQLVVNNDGKHLATEASGTIGLAAGKHRITVLYFNSEPVSSLYVSYMGPGISKKQIPDSVLFRHTSKPAPTPTAIRTPTPTNTPTATPTATPTPTP